MHLQKYRSDAMLERHIGVTVICRKKIHEGKYFGVIIWSFQKIRYYLGAKKVAHFFLFFYWDYKEINSSHYVNTKLRSNTLKPYRLSDEWNMTRKTEAYRSRLDSALRLFYCELCHIKYSSFEKHCESEAHLGFGKDTKYLNGEIAQDSNISALLKLNSVSSDDTCNSFGSEDYYTAPLTRNKMHRTRTTSMYDRIKQSSLSPAANDSNHRLRSRSQISAPNNFLGTTAEDNGHSVRPNSREGAREVRELRSSTRFSGVTKHVQLSENELESRRPKRTCIKQKRISADERLVVDNKTYYKVEVMTNKLRSSAPTIREAEVPRKAQIPISRENDKGLIVKFRRMRYSELARLNDEAENFLFPRSKDEPNLEEGAGNLNASASFTESVTETAPHNKLKSDPEEEASMDSTSSEVSIAKKKRRRTQAEAFITDNQKYYKFETPCSRLRYQGSFLPQIPTKSQKINGEYPSKRLKVEENESAESGKFNLDHLKFSFETIPKYEPWYQTFKRQDRGDVYYTSFNNYSYERPFLLPYEMGPLPPLDPRLCISAYNQIKKEFTDPASETTSAGCSTPEIGSVLEEADGGNKIEDNTGTSEDSRSETEMELCKRKMEGIRQSGKNPRKSPRQHASTLAILSNLIQHRKRRGINKNRKSEGTVTRQSLPTIPEDAVKELESDCDIIAKNIDDMLSLSCHDLDEWNLPCNQNSCFRACFKSDIIEILESYEKMKRPEAHVRVRRVSKKVFGKIPGRKPGRKKKKNRTGWPNKNRRTVRKEMGNARSANAADSQEGDSEGTRISGRIIDISVLSNCVNSKVLKCTSGDVENGKLKGSKECLSDLKHKHFNKGGNRVIITPSRKEHRGSSSDSCAEIVVASVGDKMDCVNVDLDKWENAEKVLVAKLTNGDSVNSDLQFQPIVRVQKLDGDVVVKRGIKRFKLGSSSRIMNRRPRRMPASPKSPRILRKPRGRWYRER